MYKKADIDTFPWELLTKNIHIAQGNSFINGLFPRKYHPIYPRYQVKNNCFHGIYREDKNISESLDPKKYPGMGWRTIFSLKQIKMDIIHGPILKLNYEI